MRRARDAVRATMTRLYGWTQEETDRAMDQQDYERFLAGKARAAVPVGREPGPTHESLYPFQKAIVDWAVRLGRAAVFADCGLGKTRIQVEWARQMGDRVLIVAPLSVARQTIREAASIGVTVRYVTEPDAGPGITITNYQRLHRFVGAPYDAIVLDESSILKSLNGTTRTMLLREFTGIPYRLCCTATPAPNDIAEMANHAQFLGVMDRVEMLATFFVHDQDGWRLKGHAREAFWKWMTTWALYIRRPSDLGFDDGAFVLPALTIEGVEVRSRIAPEGALFADVAGGLGTRAAVRTATASERVKAAVALMRAHDEPWIVWCGLNAEQDAIRKALGGDCVSVDGNTPEEDRDAMLASWISGEVPVLVSKVSVFGFGLNLQNCARVLFLGMGDSYEGYYQAIRRCWRFGQRRPVTVHIVTSDAEASIVENVKRKEREAEETAREVVAAVRDTEIEAVRGVVRTSDAYEEAEASGAGWRMLLGDSVKRLAEIEPESVGLSVFSPPFASLYTYSASDRDLGNSKDYDEFFLHFGFIASALLRVTMPCRRACVHVQQVSTTKAVHGVIGWRDFRADTVRLFVERGWVYDGEVVIDKDPQAQAIRTKSKALMFVQKNKDSAWSRPAMADYILLFRSPGESAEPIKTDVTNEEWICWARPVWYGIRESNTLNAALATQDRDERHICPLQLETIERCVRLWSNRGDLVLSPFAGIGSEGHEAVRLGRRFVGIELKRGYFEQALRNLRSAERLADGGLFRDAVTP